MKRFLCIFLTALTAFSCNFLDELPDSRTEIDSEEKIVQLLVSAYPQFHPAVFLELMSDNVDDFIGEENVYSQRYTDQYGLWQDDTESAQYDNPKNVWETSYSCIATANQALMSIEEMGTPESLLQYKGEALMIRAYNHFVLASIFCMPYNPETASSELGIPYSTEPETALNPQYERGTLAEVYSKIDADIQEALPLVGDSYTVPKYHFTREAAYAFATRFYLFYQDWNRVIEYADEVLGGRETSYQHDWSATAAKTYDFDVYTQDYTSASSQANILIATGYSLAGVIFGPYAVSKRFTLTSLTDKEVCEHGGPWGLTYNTDFAYRLRLFTYTTSTYSFTCVPKYPYLFQYADAVAGIGYPHSLFPIVTGEEVLLNRAEAKILKSKIDEGLKDLYIWQSMKFSGFTYAINAPSVEWYYGSVGDYDPLLNTQGNRKLHPQGFTVRDGEMNNAIQCCLQCRRINFVHDGMRWFDIGRYGIDIYRRLIDKNSRFDSVEATLPYDDPRHAVQIPQDVVSAGLQPNPRN